MASLARIDEVVDAVAARVRELWKPEQPDAVHVDDEPEFNTDPARGEVFRGRQVVVLPESYDSPEAATRGEDVNDYGVMVLVARHHPGPGQVPRAWVRAERLWVEQVIYKPLTDPRQRLMGTLWPVQPSGVDPVYDAEELRLRKIFFSVVRLTFREHADA